jgi:hypothetical protein
VGRGNSLLAGPVQVQEEGSFDTCGRRVNPAANNCMQFRAFKSCNLQELHLSQSGFFCCFDSSTAVSEQHVCKLVLQSRKLMNNWLYEAVVPAKLLAMGTAFSFLIYILSGGGPFPMSNLLA